LTNTTIAAKLLAGDSDLNEARITFLIPPSFIYIVISLCAKKRIPDDEHLEVAFGKQY